MSGRKPYGPRFTILQRSQLLGNDKIKPIERRDRFLIDNWKLESSWIVNSFRNSFKEKADRVRLLLNIPHLDYDEDIRSKSLIFVPKNLNVGTNSHYLVKHPQVAKSIEKLIYTNFLLPLGWSYNFYPFIEYFILYGKRTTLPIRPNPLQLDLILNKHKELGRNTYTKSDIQFLKQQARLLIGATHKRSSKSHTHKVEMIELLLKSKPSSERPPRNPVLKILCLDIYNGMSKNKSEYLHWEEKQYDQFLKAKVPDLVDSYEAYFKIEIDSRYQKPITDKEAYLALRRYYPEYKKLVSL